MTLDPEHQRTRSVRAAAILVGATATIITLIVAVTVVAVRASHDHDRSAQRQVRGRLGLGMRALDERAPTFTLPRLSGDGNVGLSDYRDEVVVLNFWRSDCTPCRDEFSLLQGEKDRTQVLGISTDSIPADARHFVASENASWPQALDEHLAVAEAYGVRSALPQTYFIRPDGTIAYRVYGQLSPRLLQQGITEAKTTSSWHP